MGCSAFCRSLSRDRRRERSLSRDRNHKPSRSLSASRRYWCSSASFDVYFSAVTLIWLVHEQLPHSDVLRRAVYFTLALPAMCQPAFAKYFFIPLSSQPLQVYWEKIKRPLGVTGSSMSQCILVAVLYDGLRFGCLLLCITVFFRLGWSHLRVSGCSFWSC